jgi:hypothetical protein
VCLTNVQRDHGEEKCPKKPFSALICMGLFRTTGEHGPQRAGVAEKNADAAVASGARELSGVERGSVGAECVLVAVIE